MGECLLLVHRPPPMHLSIGSPCSYGGFQHRNHRCGAGSSQNAVSCKAMANKELNPDHGHEQQQLVAGKGYLMPLKKLEHVIRFENARGQKGVEGMAWLGQKFFQRDEVTDADEKTKRQQKVQETFRKINQAEKERLQNEFERYRKARLQVEREQVQLKAWTNFHDWLLGDLKGTPHDPEPGGSIPFSQFRTLLEAGKVNYVDYADYGEHIAAVLAYYADKGNKSEQKVTIKDGLIQAPERPLVYKRHWVQQMPADAMNDVWKRLHPQLKGIRIIKTNTIPQLLYPQLKIMTVWGLRLALATAVYLFLERNLSYFYRFRNPDDRGWNEDRDLTAGDYVLGALGESRARFLSAEEKTGVTFDDFAGQDYVKRELQEVVQLLKESKEDPTLYVPKGVLLHGPPGTGKTLLARAIAGEAGLPFFSASGSEFVEMFAGVAAARVKDLFARARNFAPSIIFIDEIDAIGAKRGGPDVGGGGVEREQGLIQMLTELDGFQTGLSKSRVLVIGATNRVDMLDPALLRKGRFDKIMAVGLPSEEGRLAILRVHAKNKPFRSEEEKETLLKGITNLTNRFSGAELANVLNEAVILSTRHDKDFIEKTELHEAIERQGGSFATGQEDVLDVTGEARTRLAYREAAVAVLECYFPNIRSPFLKTNIKTMDTMVNMEYAEPPDYVYAKKNEYVESIVRICAPRIVEELIFGKDNVSWLSGSFLSEAGILVDRLIFQTGMTALGRTYYKTTKDVLPHLNAKVQALRDEYMRFAVQKCTSVLLEYRSALETMADRLMEKQELEAAEIWEIFKKSPRVPQPEVYPVDGYGPLVDIGRWGIHGVSLPGRVTFHPGNVGYATFGAPKPIQVQFIHDDTWEYFNAKVKRNMQELEKKLQTEEGRKWVSDELLQRYFFADHY